MLLISILFSSGYNVRVFLSGDYLFLCALYGLSGASGKIIFTASRIHMKTQPSMYDRKTLLSVVHHTQQPIEGPSAQEGAFSIPDAGFSAE